MRRNRWAALSVVLSLLLGAAAFAADKGGGKAGDAGKTGEQLFRDNCASCHANGGNVITPAKGLRQKNLAANNIKTASDIVKVMRNPGAGMPKYDEKTIPDPEAKKIAYYIIKTFR